MDRVKKLNELYRVAIGTIATLATSFIQAKLSTKVDNQNFGIILTVMTVTISILLINFFFENIFNNSIFLRRIVFGNEFIEGYWYDVTYDEKSKTIKHGVLLSIRYENNNFIINGVGYSPSGERVATFKSTNSNYSNRVLFFQYESHTKYQNDFIELGVNQLCFDNPATSYTGFYLDYGNTMRFTIFGDKVDDKDLKAFNKFKTNNDKMAFVMSKIQEKTKFYDQPSIEQ